MIYQCGYISRNPRPQSDFNLKVCHWNIGSIVVLRFEKHSLLKTYNAIHNFGIICLSETFLNSSYSSDDHDLTLDSYKLIRADHPLNIKRGGVCIYYRESLPIKVVDVSQLNECLLIEIICNNQKCFIVSLYCSPSQSNEQFDNFIENFELLLDSIYD